MRLVLSCYSTLQDIVHVLVTNLIRAFPSKWRIMRLRRHRNLARGYRTIVFYHYYFPVRRVRAVNLTCYTTRKSDFPRHIQATSLVSLDRYESLSARREDHAGPCDR
jgi:hypothetical protein